MHMDFADIGPPKKRPPRARWYILLGLLVPFTFLTYLAVSSGPPNNVRDRPVILTTLATITGPFVGPIARHGQACCLHAALVIAAVLGPILLLGLIAQVVPLPFSAASRCSDSVSGRSAGSRGSSAALYRLATPCSEA